MRWVVTAVVFGCTGCLKPATCVELLQCAPDGVELPNEDASFEAGGPATSDQASDGIATSAEETLDGTIETVNEAFDAAATSRESAAFSSMDATNVTFEAEGSTAFSSDAGSWSSAAPMDAGDAGELQRDSSHPDNQPPRVVQVVAGMSHTCALSSLGTVRCWGNGSEGQLGLGNTNSVGDTEPPSTSSNVDIGATVVKLTAGGRHTCALSNDGHVRCWGSNYSGQLGYPNNNENVGDDETPASMGDVNIGGNVAYVAAGVNHTCVLLGNGGVRCWGSNDRGQLGYGNDDEFRDAEAALAAGDVNVGGNVVSLAAGHKHNCALLNNDRMRCWGGAYYGQLGYGNLNNVGDNESPAEAGDVNVGGVVRQVAADGDRTCALIDGGYVRCWGFAPWGQLGYANTNNIGDDETPASAGDVNIGGVATHLGAGSNHTCTVLDSGSVRCWGAGDSGALGYGNTNYIGDDEAPVSAGDVDVGASVISLAAGGAHTCALLDQGRVRCWGDNRYGQLGYGHTEDIGDDETPASAGDVDIGW